MPAGTLGFWWTCAGPLLLALTAVVVVGCGVRVGVVAVVAHLLPIDLHSLLSVFPDYAVDVFVWCCGPVAWCFVRPLQVSVVPLLS